VTNQITDEQENIILDAVDRFLERDVKPYAHALEQADEYPHEIVEKMKALGLFGATIAAEYGGLGLGARTYAQIVERVSTVWMSVSGIFNSHLIMAAATFSVIPVIIVFLFGQKYYVQGIATTGIKGA